MMLYKAEQLQVLAGERTILDISELAIEAGKIYGLLGANGAGKTTLLNILAFLESPTSGSMEFVGKPVHFSRTGLQQLRRQVVMVAQHPVLFSTTVYNNIAFGLKIRKISPAKREKIIDQVLEQVDLTAFKHEPAQGLSGGEVQRIALARALALSPRVLLCDEPTSSVDVENQAAIIGILKEMNSSHNISIIFTSHDRLQAAALAHHTLILDHGSLTGVARENIFDCTFAGEQQGSEQLCLLQNRVRLLLPAVGRTEGKKQISLDPKDITLVADDPEPGSEAVLQGQLVQLMAEAGQIRMVVDVGVLITVLLDPAQYRQEKPAIGDRLSLQIGAVQWLSR